MGYKIAKVSSRSSQVGSPEDTLTGMSGGHPTTVTSLSLHYPFQREYDTYMEGMVALDKLTSKGTFILVKINA